MKKGIMLLLILTLCLSSCGIKESQRSVEIVDGEKQPVVKNQVRFEGDDHHLYRIIMDEVDSYFSGDKTLEEAAKIIQNKASIYVSESSK